MTIQEIQAATPVGNHYDDAELLNACSSIAMDPKQPKNDRLEALHQIDRIMGVECPYPTPEELLDYLKAWHGEDYEEEGL